MENDISDIPSVKKSLCQGCHAYPYQCFCSEIPKIQTRTEVNFIVHHRESHLSSNTSWPGHQVIKNSNFYLRGLPDKPLSTRIESINSSNEKSKSNAFVLFPSEHAIDIDSVDIEELQSNPCKMQLYVPDGTWQQAQRMVKREPLFKGMQHIQVKTKRISKYQLRKQPSEGRLCTLEALIEVLKFLEDEQATNALEWVLEMHIVTNLQRRGLIKKEEYLNRISNAQKFLIN